MNTGTAVRGGGAPSVTIAAGNVARVAATVTPMAAAAAVAGGVRRTWIGVQGRATRQGEGIRHRCGGRRGQVALDVLRRRTRQEIARVVPTCRPPVVRG